MPKSKEDIAWDGLSLEDLSYSCGCGTPMAVHELREDVKLLLKCRRCGPVAYATITLTPAYAERERAE